MAASTIQNPEVRSESKSAKKKKAKAEAAVTLVPTPASAVEEKSVPETANSDAAYESPYLRELYKNIRNINKKITNASKVDNILEQNPDKTLDELVVSRKINTDQKAQILKKPSLEAALAQYQEQIAHFKKFDDEHKARAEAAVARTEAELTGKHKKEIQEAVSAAKAEASESAQKQQQEALLVVSQFLRLAAARRQEDVDPSLDENQALEGILVEVYTGDNISVNAMTNLIAGSDEQTTSIEGHKLNTTYAQIKEAATAFVPPGYDDEVSTEIAQEEPDHNEVSEYPVESDPTIANAGLTEINAVPTAVLFKNCDAEETPSAGFPKNAGFGDGANAAAEDNWNRSNDLSASQDEWVDVRYPRDAAETETGIEATPAALTNTQSWADEQPDGPQVQHTKVDGFSEVQRNHRGQQPQRGGRGGRGSRGDGQNRGRGGYRGRGNGEGHRGGPRGGANRGPRSHEA